MYGALLAVVVVLVLATRAATWGGKPQKRRCGKQAPTMVVLGSGAMLAWFEKNISRRGPAAPMNND